MTRFKAYFTSYEQLRVKYDHVWSHYDSLGTNLFYHILYQHKSGRYKRKVERKRQTTSKIMVVS